ncbi:hypothetical protein TNCV_4213231 [Trichonephila clavipes]|nr:hypothetical protein TNCV_4213231 [Trichonephila clavipes]
MASSSFLPTDLGREDNVEVGQSPRALTLQLLFESLKLPSIGPLFLYRFQNSIIKSFKPSPSRFLEVSPVYIFFLRFHNKGFLRGRVVSPMPNPRTWRIAAILVAFYDTHRPRWDYSFTPGHHTGG